MSTLTLMPEPISLDVKLHPTARGRFVRRGLAGLLGAVLAGALALGCDDGRNVSPQPDGGDPIDMGEEDLPPGAYPAIGPYTPVSDVRAHARVSLDNLEIAALLQKQPIDYDAVRTIYAEGKNSVNGDGSVRTIRGFASAERDEPIWNLFVDYFDGDATWLDTYVSAAIDGTGPFAKEVDAVRRQGIEKGIVNQIMIAWMFHELDAAIAKAENGELDPAEGAPHNWDEAWAFYHGEDPTVSPFATANKRGDNFGTGTAVNDAILAEMVRGSEALVGEDAATAIEAYEEIRRQVLITYIQAAIRYGIEMEGALKKGDAESARVEQAEGLSFYRVIAPFIAEVNAKADATVMRYFDLAQEPREGSAAAVMEALQSVYGALGISADEIGSMN